MVTVTKLNSRPKYIRLMDLPVGEFGEGRNTGCLFLRLRNHNNRSMALNVNDNSLWTICDSDQVIPVQVTEISYKV